MFKKIFPVIMMCWLVGCHHPTAVSQQTIKVKPSTETQTLYYSGTIEPILAYTIQNIDADGVITEKYFEYGTHIDKNQILFVIQSNQLAIKYQTALTAYVKAKKSLADIRYQVEGEKELSKLKIVSKQEYMTSETQLFNAELDYDQASKALYDVMEMAGIPKSKLNNLKSEDPEEVTKALTNVPNSVKIVSPITGVALYPKSSSVGDTTTTDLKVGSNVKANDPLVLVHNKQGIAVTIKVNQLDISKIRYNEKAIITSDAFPGITLTAEINRIDREATVPEFGGSLPIFQVRIVVPELSPTEYNAIRMGMTAEVAIQITTPEVISVPLSAVFTENTQSFVNVMRANQLIKVPVQTGTTTLDSVDILSGLQTDDEVVINATSH